MDKKMVLDAYLNAKSDTVTMYDRYAVDKRAGNRGRFSMEEFLVKEAEFTTDGWRVHRVKWSSAVERAEKRVAAKPKSFSLEALNEFLAAHPKITMRKALELLNA